MKSLVGIIKESLVNEARVPVEIKKLKSEVERVESSEMGNGWLIGEWIDPYGGEADNDMFRFIVEDCIKAFKGVVIAGQTINRKIDIKKALDILERNGEDPESYIGFVFHLI